MKTRIAALGDSLIKGVVLNEKNRYSVLDNSFIEIISEEMDLYVENYAKFGCTVDFGCSVLERHGDEIASSDYTFLEYGGNDCDFNWMEIADDPESRHTPKTILESFRQKFLYLIYKVKELGSRPVIFSLPPIDSDLYFSFITRMMDQRQKNNVKEWLGGDVNVIARWHESYNKVLFELAEKTASPVIDITTPFEEYKGRLKEVYCYDGIHPNLKGHQLIAASISNNYF